MVGAPLLQIDRPKSAAELANGSQRLIGPAIAVSLALYLFVLSEPLLTVRLMFYSRHEIVLSKLALDLYRSDAFLFLVVFVFGIVAPGLKLIISAISWYMLPVPYACKINPTIILLGKLSMLDIMLLAILVVSIKGVGAGSVEIKGGLYAYVTLVLGTLLLSLWMGHAFQVFDKQFCTKVPKIDR